MNSSSKSTIKNKFRNTNLNTNVKKKFINSRRLLLLSKSLGLFQRRQRVFKKYTPLIEKYYEAKKSTFSKDFNNFLNNNLLSIWMDLAVCGFKRLNNGVFKRVTSNHYFFRNFVLDNLSKDKDNRIRFTNMLIKVSDKRISTFKKLLIIKRSNRRTRKSVNNFSLSTLDSKIYSPVFTRILSSFQNLEKFKSRKESYFSLYFDSNNILSWNSLQRNFILTTNFFFLHLILMLKDNPKLFVKEGQLLVKPSKYSLVSDITLTRVKLSLAFSNTVVGSFKINAFKSIDSFFNKLDYSNPSQVYSSSGLKSSAVYLGSWQLILLHTQYVYRNTRGRLLGVYVPDKNVFHVQKAFFSTTLYPYGFTILLRKGSHMTLDFYRNTASFNHVRLMGFVTSLVNFTQYSNKVRLHKWYCKHNLNALKGSLNKVNKSDVLFLRHKVRKIKKVKELEWKKKFSKKLIAVYFKYKKFLYRKNRSRGKRAKFKRFIYKPFLKRVRKVKRRLFKWVKRCTKSKVAIRIRRICLQALKLKRLPTYSASVNNYFSFFKLYDILGTRSTTSNISHLLYNKSNGQSLVGTRNSLNGSISFKNIVSFLLLFENSFFLKSIFFENKKILLGSFFSNLDYFIKLLSAGGTKTLLSLNLYPNHYFRFVSSKNLFLVKANMIFKENLVPWVYTNIIQFIEFCSGRRALLHVYSFMNQSMDAKYITLYKRWIPRLYYYERKLGHRFFLEEALHILHMSFNYQDVKLLASWLGAIIKRISFWKTRFIFRFIRFLFNNYFSFIFENIGVKGFKVKLKGKISVAGNSRKRTILYRVGKTSHASCNLRVVHNFSTIVTFTGVQGFQVWIFY